MLPGAPGLIQQQGPVALQLALAPGAQTSQNVLVYPGQAVAGQLPSSAPVVFAQQQPVVLQPAVYVLPQDALGGAWLHAGEPVAVDTGQVLGASLSHASSTKLL